MFKPLTRENVDKITGLMLEDINKRLADRRITIKLTEAAYKFVAENGFDPVYGARPLKRFIQKEVETRAAMIILENKAKEGSVITVDSPDGEDLTAYVA